MTGSGRREESPSRPARIGLLGASFATRNLGVNALAMGAVRSMLQRYPDAEVFLLDYDKFPARHQVRIDGREVPVSLVNLRFSKNPLLPNHIARLLLEAMVMRLLPSRRWRERLAARNPWLRRICQTDIFASLAGGDSFSDIYGLERLLYMTLPQVLVLLAGKRLVLLPQTLGPFRGRISKTIARHILRRAERVYSRDHRGADTVRALIGEHLAAEKLAFCYDLGFVLEPAAPPHLEIEGLPLAGLDRPPLVGLNISGLLFMGGYTRNNMFGLRVDYRELVARLVDFLAGTKHARVLLVPHVFGETPNSESDAAACADCYERFRSKYPGRVGLVRGSYNEREIKHIIGQCDMFIGSRMHACIAALSQSVPAIAVAYSDKFIGVMETIGFEQLVADPRKMGLEEILEKLAGIYEKRQDIRRELERKIPPIQRRVLTLFDEIPAPAPVVTETALSPAATSPASR